MLNPLYKHIQSFISLNETEKQILNNCLEPVFIKKKEHLLIENISCNVLYYVSKGCLRSYYIDKKGNEQTFQFAIENWWISDYEAYINSTKTSLYIQTVEDCEIISLSKKNENELFKKVPKIERYFRIIYQKAYTAAQLRIKYLYSYSREELYIRFAQDFPEFLQRVPNYMIASYLGFTPEYLSEIKRKMLS